MPTVGDRIKEVREALGWTQDKLATEAKISKGFLSEVEGKGKNISLDLLVRIATAMGASVAYLVSGEGNEPLARKPVIIPPELSQASEQLKLSYPEMLDLLDAYNSIVARRSNRSRGTMSVQDWKNLHTAIKSMVRKIYG